MLEATPGRPYGHEIKDFLEVEENMKRRYHFYLNLIKTNNSTKTHERY
jgi:hypothetical protein